jgi:hypothetical protein
MGYGLDARGADFRDDLKCWECERPITAGTRCLSRRVAEGGGEDGVLNQADSAPCAGSKPLTAGLE